MIVDALDECLENVRNALLKYFKALPSNVRLLVTTRHIHKITQNFEVFHEIRASPSDLRKYTLSRIDNSLRLEEYVREHPSLREDVCDGIVSKVDGV